MRKFLIIAALPIFTGCANPQQVQALDDGKCRSYGMRPGTAEYAQCRMNMENNRALNRAARATAGGILICDDAGCHL